MILLARHAKEMTLVVVLQRPVRVRPEQSIEYLVAHADLHAAGDGRVQRARLLEQPTHRLALHALGGGDHGVGEAGGEGLGQHEEVGRGVRSIGSAPGTSGTMLAHEPRELLTVGRRIVPDRVGLHERHLQRAQRRHSQTRSSRAIAASSVCSCLAKQSRTNRWPSGASP